MQSFAAFLWTCWQASQTEWSQELECLSETTVGLRLMEVLGRLRNARLPIQPISAHTRRQENWPRLPEK